MGRKEIRRRPRDQVEPSPDFTAFTVSYYRTERYSLSRSTLKGMPVVLTTEEERDV